MCVCVCVCSVVSATLWIAAHQVPLSLEFSRQEHWSGLPFSAPRNVCDPGIKPKSLVSPALAGIFFTPEPPGKTKKSGKKVQIIYFYSDSQKSPLARREGGREREREAEESEKTQNLAEGTGPPRTPA